MTLSWGALYSTHHRSNAQIGETLLPPNILASTTFASGCWCYPTAEGTSQNSKAQHQKRDLVLHKHTYQHSLRLKRKTCLRNPSLPCYIHVYIYMHTYIYIYMYIHLSLALRPSLSPHTYIYMYTHLHIASAARRNAPSQVKTTPKNVGPSDKSRKHRDRKQVLAVYGMM